MKKIFLLFFLVLITLNVNAFLYVKASNTTLNEKTNVFVACDSSEIVKLEVWEKGCTETDKTKCADYAYASTPCNSSRDLEPSNGFQVLGLHELTATLGEGQNKETAKTFFNVKFKATEQTSIPEMPLFFSLIIFIIVLFLVKTIKNKAIN